MKKRKLGNTDIELTSIGFGGAPIGNLFEELDEPTCYDILQHSYKSNINILYKDGSLKDIVEASDQLNISALSKSVKKHFFCYPKECKI